MYSTWPSGSSVGDTRCETLRGPSFMLVPSRLTVATCAVTWRSYSSWNCGVPSSTFSLVVNNTCWPGKKIGYTRSLSPSVSCLGLVPSAFMVKI